MGESIIVHQSRITGRKIPSYSLIDTTRDDPQSHYLLLKSQDAQITCVFLTLSAIYKEYAVKEDAYGSLDMHSIGRFAAYHITSYLFGESDTRYRMGCLVNEGHGAMKRFGSRSYIIWSRIDALRSGAIDRNNLCPVDSLI